MEILTILFIWPFLILAIGLVFIALSDVVFGNSMTAVSTMLITLLMIALYSAGNKKKGDTSLDELKAMRTAVVALSISAMVPIFIRYLLGGFDNSLPAVIGGLIVGFGLLVWGMFIKGNRVVLASNLIGGGLSIFYVYAQLWELGGMARVIAAGFGLLVAVIVSSIKLKDKLS